MSRLLVASEYTDPSFYVSDILGILTEEYKKNPDFGLLLISKNVEGTSPIVEATLPHGIPIIVHATITGHGGTVMEPRVPATTDSMTHLRSLVDLFRRYSQPIEHSLVLRIDPVIPEETSLISLLNLISKASSIGIRRCRASVVDYYPFVRKRFDKLGIRTYGSSFQAPPSTIKYYLSFLLELCRSHGMSLELCAEHLTGALHTGCAYSEDWDKFGLHMDKTTRKQRVGCYCDIRKYDLLQTQGRYECGYRCLYCYWSKYRGD